MAQRTGALHDDYTEIFKNRQKAVIESFGEASSHIERITMEFGADESVFQEIKLEVLRSHGDAFVNETVVAASGIEVKRRRIDHDMMITISVAPAFFQLNIPLLKKFADLVGSERGRVVARLDHSSRVNFEMWDLTGKFHGTAIKAVGERFEFDEVVFEFGIVGYELDRYGEESSPIWGILFNPSSLDWPAKIKDLLELLVRLVILEEEDIPF